MIAEQRTISQDGGVLHQGQGRQQPHTSRKAAKR